MKNNHNSPESEQRRKLLGATLGAAGLYGVAKGLNLVELALAKNDEEAVSSLQRWGLLIDSEKCRVGCSACVSAL